MKVVIAPDSFKGTLTARQAADAIARGWRSVRPTDQIALVPMSDGGDGLLGVVATDSDAWYSVEVAGPLGHPVHAKFLVREDGTAVIESAAACGLALMAEPRNPLHGTTFGVGQLLEAARGAGARSMLVGLGGSATVDGGAGALSGMGFRLQVDDGGGLKIGAADLVGVERAARGWAADWSDVSVEMLSDVRTVLLDAPREFGPQKGASPEDVAALEKALQRWADVAERDLAGRELRHEAGTGAAGGLGFGLAAGIGAVFADGAARVAEFVGLPTALEDADLVVVGEGRLDDTSAAGKVVSRVAVLAKERQVEVSGVVGSAQAGAAQSLGRIVEAAPDGPGKRPEDDVAAAAARLAATY